MRAFYNTRTDFHMEKTVRTEILWDFLSDLFYLENSVYELRNYIKEIQIHGSNKGLDEQMN